MSVTLSRTTYPVTYNTSKTGSTRVKVSQFGDGYRQYIEDGINTSDEQWNVDFKPLDLTTANALETILLNSTKGTDYYIYWQGIGESESKYYTAHNINKNPLGDSLWKINCQFKREFPLG